MLLAHTLEDAQKLMVILKNFCMHSGLALYESKEKVMLVRNNNEEKPCIAYNNEMLELVESFTYIGLEFLANHKWHECSICQMKARKEAYYAFENMHDVGDIKC